MNVNDRSSSIFRPNPGEDGDDVVAELGVSGEEHDAALLHFQILNSTNNSAISWVSSFTIFVANAAAWLGFVVAASFPSPAKKPAEEVAGRLLKFWEILKRILIFGDLWLFSIIWRFCRCNSSNILRFFSSKNSR